MVGFQNWTWSLSNLYSIMFNLCQYFLILGLTKTVFLHLGLKTFAIRANVNQISKINLKRYFITLLRNTTLNFKTKKKEYFSSLSSKSSKYWLYRQRLNLHLLWIKKNLEPCFFSYDINIRSFINGRVSRVSYYCMELDVGWLKTLKYYRI